MALDEALRYAPPSWASTHKERFPAIVQEIQALLNLLYGYTQGKFNQFFRGVQTCLLLLLSIEKQISI
ncbi:hypothetical protein BPO_0687 [Bergeyella porcorum]|uniref:Uncharacterized protein n=1 Tax=Bergeyella porcorum TaxID=1735111 RepID=A0AAU0EZC7_9FLAO